MSVYTPQQHSLGQQFGQSSPLGQQQPYGQQGFGQQQRWLSQGQQQFGQQYPQQGFGPFSSGQPGVQQGQGQIQGQLPVLVTELALRCAATAATAVVEQLRMDPQILMGIQAQGQIPPHAWGSVLVDCARKIAPVLHTVLAQITQGQQGQIGQQGQYGQSMGQFPGQWQGLSGQQQYGQMSPMGLGLGI
ncbi:hypothetical protein ACFVZH_36510 [Streptomyces sp. NPDC059534]|uniref:hypothetical protein n=1 Tax=Streptomyces sp. NPDC059534 TaxID=3346859 RepID=UPI00368015B6